MPPPFEHRPPHRWHARHIFAVLGFRRPVAQHSKAEGELLQRCAQRRRSVVELGVAEGGSAREIRESMDPNGTLHLVDPYTGRRPFGINMARIVARRLVGSTQGAAVEWLRATSVQAARGWDTDIDFLFLDADHSYDAVRRDWSEWSPHVVRGGVVALHDARVFPGGWTTADSGPVRFMSELTKEASGTWLIENAIDSLVVVRRRSAEEHR
jgi:predicted O-methyltransferase YrrM